MLVPSLINASFTVLATEKGRSPDDRLFENHANAIIDQSILMLLSLEKGKSPDDHLFEMCASAIAFQSILDVTCH